MTTPRGCVLAVCLGVAAVHFISWATPQARAAWCWDPAPRCQAPVVTSGSCQEGTLINHGGHCTPQCSDGLVPSCTCPLPCPSSVDDGAGCFGDLGNNWWWEGCLGYDATVCVNDLLLGEQRPHGVENPLYAPAWTCVSPGQEDADCARVTQDSVKVVDLDTPWNTGTILLLVGLLVFGLVTGVLSYFVPYGKLPRLSYRPFFHGWTLASGVGTVVAVVGVIAYMQSISALDGFADVHQLFLNGLAAGTLSILVVFFAYFKAGAHTLVGMSREAAWRIHICFSVIFLLVAAFHMRKALNDKGDLLWDNGFYVMAFIGFWLMVVGVLPSLLAAAGLIHYDRFKLLHFLSFWGYILVVVHMMDNAVVLGTTRSYVVALANVATFAGFVVQKVWAKAFAAKATVERCEVVKDASGEHIFLTLNAANFKFRAGQWAHLAVPKASPVPHPFTIVPGMKDGQVQFFIKVSGKFTTKLAELIRTSGESTAIGLEGPYGLPPLPAPALPAVAFVVGGVGVTPTLSMAAEALRQGAQVRLYWAVRSMELLRRCGPLLVDAGLKAQQCNIQVTAGGPSALALGEGAEDRLMPLGARFDNKLDLPAWIRSQQEEFKKAGCGKGLLFVCGPPRMAADAKKASGPFWYLHIEEFMFLQSFPKCGSRGKKPTGAVLPSVVGNTGQ